MMKKSCLKHTGLYINIRLAHIKSDLSDLAALYIFVVKLRSRSRSRSQVRSRSGPGQVPVPKGPRTKDQRLGPELKLN